MKTLPPWSAATLVGAALLAGCGGGDGSNGAASSPVPQGSSSLEAQLGFSAAASPEAQAQVETDIAACMKAQGFEYTPVDPVARQAALTGKSNLSDEDFTQQFGYGIATLYGRGSDQADPNERIRQSLSPADRRAYDVTLTGGMPEQTYFRAADTGDFTELGGCTKQAADKLFGGAELLTTLQRALDDLDQAIQQDQRMVRAQEAWRRCVRDKTGQTFEDSEGLELEIQKQLAAIVGPLPSGESAPGEFANRTPDRPVDQAALAQLRQTEVQYAVADATCEEKHLAPVEEEVTKEKEQQFRDRNAELLRRVKPLGVGG
jgi:hypothetical protein